MKRRVNRNSSKDDLLPMTVADAQAADQGRQRRRPPGSSKNSSTMNRCGVVFCLAIIVGLAVFVFVVQRKHSSSERENMLDPYRDYIHEQLGKQGIKISDKKHHKRGDHHHLAKEDIPKRKKAYSAVAVEDEEDSNGRLKPQKFERRKDEKPEEELPFYNKFPTLRYPLLNSRLVFVYFAASWCAMSKPFTRQMDSLFNSVLLDPVTIPIANNATPSRLVKRHGASLVFVSSDISTEDMEEYQRDTWMTIPYNHEDRSELKRHFKTCAKIELQRLGMDERDREIPALIVLSGETHEVLSLNGVDDVKSRGAQAMQHWMELDDKLLASSNTTVTE
mmetsp:Transcript_15905/g.20778  ORF Transcript_15905/g.20778 Transcript_15905/m.20778 type:complete len:334 (-) Transcript_15905:29-1030(-)